jgi:hypothetical protein
MPGKLSGKSDALLDTPYQHPDLSNPQINKTMTPFYPATKFVQTQSQKIFEEEPDGVT